MLRGGCGCVHARWWHFSGSCCCPCLPTGGGGESCCVGSGETCPPEVERFALQLGISAALAKGCQKLVVISDSLPAVESLFSIELWSGQIFSLDCCRAVGPWLGWGPRAVCSPLVRALPYGVGCAEGCPRRRHVSQDCRGQTPVDVSRFFASTC
jgi:hypothetical protein